MASIYNVADWDNSGNIDYKVNDIVKDSNGLFWYAITDNNDTNTPIVSSQFWGGNITITIGGTASTKPYFLWAPSFNTSVSHAPRTKDVQFGDGYQQRIKDGINNRKLSLSLSFENRNEKEARAILHFLHTREAYETFYFKTPKPYSVIKKFICKTFSSNHVFTDNYTVQCGFEEIS